tara:strand:- start:54 stop:428 length:375 start_codon:yes stop_codon:yes gene_type:complete
MKTTLILKETLYNFNMKWCIVFFIFFMSDSLLAKDKNELEIFAEKYLETFQDKLSYKKFRMVLDVDNSEIVIDQKYGTFKYIFDEYHIDDGEMIIEKGYDKIFFQLVNNDGNPLFSLNYKITFN